MKRYLVFKGDKYYPCGGMEDFVGDFYFLANAKKALRPEDGEEEADWWHIYDTVKREIIEAY